MGAIWTDGRSWKFHISPNFEGRCLYSLISMHIVQVRHTVWPLFMKQEYNTLCNNIKENIFLSFSEWFHRSWNFYIRKILQNLPIIMSKNGYRWSFQSNVSIVSKFLFILVKDTLGQKSIACLMMNSYKAVIFRRSKNWLKGTKN